MLPATGGDLKPPSVEISELTVSRVSCAVEIELGQKTTIAWCVWTVSSLGIANSAVGLVLSSQVFQNQPSFWSQCIFYRDGDRKLDRPPKPLLDVFWALDSILDRYWEKLTRLNWNPCNLSREAADRRCLILRPEISCQRMAVQNNPPWILYSTQPSIRVSEDMYPCRPQTSGKMSFVFKANASVLQRRFFQGEIDSPVFHRWYSIWGNSQTSLQKGRSIILKPLSDNYSFRNENNSIFLHRLEKILKNRTEFG